MTIQCHPDGKTHWTRPRQRQTVVGHIDQFIHMCANLTGAVALITQGFQFQQRGLARRRSPARNRTAFHDPAYQALALGWHMSLIFHF
jgi:hypothetical protein